MTRREWLQGMVLAAGAWRPDGVTQMKTRSARDAVDHVLLGAADLDRAVAWFEARTGVKPVFGGVHPGRGTRNALVSLGGRQYLEIIAPDPAQKAFNFQIDLAKLAAPKVVNWAVASDDVDAAAATAAAAKYAVYGPQEGARMRPDGSMLQWRTVGVLAAFRDAEVDPMPFFIQWGQGVKHPSEDSPGGCRMAAFELRHPKAADLSAALGLFGIKAVVTQADRPTLTAVLDTPKGRVTL
jgi:catechol 2,3-dioxygenase-like lactoylglutathione lyase family enzyme